MVHCGVGLTKIPLKWSTQRSRGWTVGHRTLWSLCLHSVGSCQSWSLSVSVKRALPCTISSFRESLSKSNFLPTRSIGTGLILSVILLSTNLSNYLLFSNFAYACNGHAFNTKSATLDGALLKKLHPIVCGNGMKVKVRSLVVSLSFAVHLAMIKIWLDTYQRRTLPLRLRGELNCPVHSIEFAWH